MGWSVKAGRLDERVTFQTQTRSQDATTGVYTSTWADLATVWADVYEVMGGETWAQGLNIEKRPISVTFRWRDDIDADMRVVWRGRTYRIVRGPIELERRVGMRLTAELHKPEGDDV